MSWGPLLCSPQCPTGLQGDTTASGDKLPEDTAPWPRLPATLADVTAVLFAKFVNLETGLFLPPPSPTTSCRTPLSPGL